MKNQPRKTGKRIDKRKENSYNETDKKKGELVMQTTGVRKSFFSSVKECEWLNGLGQKGYKLIGKKDGKYQFEVDELQTWYYSVEWLDCSPKSEKGQAYIDSRREDGVELAATFSLWAYFISSEPISVSDESRKRNAAHYRNFALILYVFDAVAAALIGYQFTVRSFLETQKILMTAPELTKSTNFFINIYHRLIYGAKRLIYLYGKLCGRLFGESKAALALGILIPLVIGLSVAGSFWTAEWLKNRPEKKRTEPEPEGTKVEKSEG